MFFISTTTVGQNFKQDFEAVNNAIKNSPHLSTVISTKMYGAGNQIKGQKSVTLKKKGNRFLYDLEDFTILINAKHVITIDKDDKSISVTNHSQQEQTNNIAPQLDELMDDMKGVEYKGIVNGNKMYSVQLEDDLYDKAEFYIDNAKSMYVRIIYYYKSSEAHAFRKAVIDFQNTDTKTPLSEDIFSENRYIKIAQGRIYPSGNYRNYSIVSED